jgi:hypothetical protein
LTPTRGWMLLLVLLLSACATPAPSGPAATTTAPAVALPTIDVRALAGSGLTCGNGDKFPAAALQGPGGAELGDDAAAAALRAVLAEGGDPQLVRSGWHRVLASDTRAQFVAPGRGGSPWVVIAVEKGPSGWTMDLAGQCRLTVVMPAGLNLASWWLDPAAGTPGPDAVAVMALVQERCGGQPLDGRVVPPVVIYQPDSVTVVFGFVPLRGGGQEQDSICGSAPPASYRVILEEPLGQRRLLDGSTIPPRDASKPPS